MKTDNKFWMIATVFILVGFVVAFNFERFTGQATTVKIPPKVAPKIYLSSNQYLSEQDTLIKSGNRLFVTVETGDLGIKKVGAIYDASGRRVANLVFSQNCGGNVCRPKRTTAIRYQVPSGWKGGYCTRITEVSTEKITEKCFTVQ
jgi:hypothetical protein